MRHRRPLLWILLLLLAASGCEERPLAALSGRSTSEWLPERPEVDPAAAPEATTEWLPDFETQLEQGNIEPAMTILAEGGSLSQLETTQRALAEAWRLYAQGEDSAARQEVEALLAKQPELRAASTLLGRIHYRENDFTSAAAALEQAARGGGAEPWYHLAQSRRRLGRWRLAATAYRSCRNADAGFNAAIVAYNLGLVLLKTNDYGQAVIEYRTYNQLAPHDLDGLFQLGRAYLGQGDHTNAALTFEAIISKDPSYSPQLVRYNLALARLRQTLYAQALKQFEAALEHDDFSDRPEIFALMATCAEKMGNYRQAIAILEKALERFPDEPQLLDRLGWNTIHSGDRQRGIEICRRAANLYFGERPPPSNQVELRLPFRGTWKVAQGNDSNRTHFGIEQKYAFDFAKVDGRGNYFRGDGDELWDYYTWDQEILSPADAVVIEATDQFQDQPPSAEFDPLARPNQIVLKLFPSGYISITHLKQGSLQVRVGQRVKAGQVLARCGNSGYTTSPHIHIQFYTGDPNKGICAPFAFSNYKLNGRLVKRGVPPQGMVVSPGD